MSDPTVISNATMVPGGTVIAPVTTETVRTVSAAPFRLPPARRHRESLDFALPTINVIFLLMLYFLIAGTLVQGDELAVAPPETSSMPADRLPRPLLVLDEAGGMTLDGAPIVPSGIADAVAASGATAGKPLNILAPRGQPARAMLDILLLLEAERLPVRIVALDSREASPD